MLSTESLLASLAFALLAAGLSGAVAARLRQSVILGYIVAGMIIGPYTPGWVADVASVEALAEIGIVLLLFVTGMEVSARDLARAGRVALAGACLQVALLIGLGYLVGVYLLGWSEPAALVLGAVASNSSSTVLSKVLAERGESTTAQARLALAWSSVQDFTTIVLVVLLGAMTGDGSGLLVDIGLQVATAAAFLVLLVPVGAKVLPLVFKQIRQIHQREVFVLSAAALALVTAWTATQFGLSPALGAFLAGVVLAESDIRHELIDGLSALRDLFVGLFFVSVGMLVDPGYFWSHGLYILAVVALIVPVKGAVVSLLLGAFRQPLRIAATGGAILAQSAEFSFLLATVGVTLGIIGDVEFSLLIAGAALSVLLSPMLIRVTGPAVTRVERWRYAQVADQLRRGPEVEALRGHCIVCGHGRVGSIVTRALLDHGLRVVVLEQNARRVLELRERGVPALLGPADSESLLTSAGVEAAGLLVVAIPERESVRRLVRFGRSVNPTLTILARTHERSERGFLEATGADEAVVGEVELAMEMARSALRASEIDQAVAEDYLDRLRHADDEGEA